MTKIKCKTLSASNDGREYTTPKGHPYTFYYGIPTEVKDPEDALHFLKAGDGKYFETTGVFKDIIKGLEDSIKSFFKPAEPKEPEKPVAPNLIVAEGTTAPIGSGAPKEIKKNILTAEGLKGLNLKQQTYLILQIQKPDKGLKSVPGRESQRIELLVKLQNEGAELLEILKGYQP